MSNLDGKVALVTGAGRGIGRAIALKLAGAGARIVMNDIDDAPAEETMAAVRDLGSEAVAVNGDVTVPDFGDRFVATAMERFGGIDIIVNNAGYAWDSVIQKTSDAQFDAMIDIHAKAPFHILRAAAGPIREMAKQEAEAGRGYNRKVVNVSSVAGVFGNAGQVGYAAGKAAIVGMTKTLCKEWGRYRVNVNAVAFGLIETRMTQPFEEKPVATMVGEREIQMGVQPQALAFVRQMIPLGRGGTPEDAANAVYLFCIPESDYVSGEILLVSGGMVL
ncbi:MAG: SDR family oxidoreductase [Hyphomicrobiales bacterium]|nr:SDR family oxidoreductase [Hyphomicrobiales bacterium]MCP5374443.1 SDR family oxidoreductase [Hyphomicrobiales bacterium]